MSNVRMTKPQFEARMTEHCAYLRQFEAFSKAQALDANAKASDYITAKEAWFIGEDLTDVGVLSGWDFGGCRFEGCKFSTLDLSNTVSHLWITVDRCDGTRIKGKGVETTTLALRRTELRSLELLDVENTSVRIAHCDIGRFEASTSNMYVEVTDTVLGRSTFTGCLGSVEYRRVHGDVKFHNNDFKRVDLIDVSCCGTITLPRWTVYYTQDMMRIGCQQHRIEDWMEYTDDQIAYMDRDALGWWRQWKPVIQQVLSTTRYSAPKTADQMGSLEFTESRWRRWAEEDIGHGSTKATDSQTLAAIMGDQA